MRIVDEESIEDGPENEEAGEEDDDAVACVVWEWDFVTCGVEAGAGALHEAHFLLAEEHDRRVYLAID